MPKAGNEVGNGYVLIKPTMDESSIGELEAKGESAGQGFGNSFSVAAGNLISGAVEKLGSAVADTFKNAFDNYANYEQLVGGVDTLFKESSAIVQENAAKAFETAGMSANEYMENVTSFSASLLQSLDGDTAAAAAYADTAMRDMSDNANKMGSDMESITNAYQGFAKQNYTMLDNLKLGYGGTKSEMERLLADASKIAGVEFNIDSYSDVIEAIHVMQTQMDISGYSADELKQKLADSALTTDEVKRVAEDMGVSYAEVMRQMEAGTLNVKDAQVLLGTTAKEGAATISGSIGKLSAAWQNFLTGVFDENADMGALGEQLFTSVGDVLANVAPRIATLLQNVILGLPDAIIATLEMLPSMLEPAIEGVFGETVGGQVMEVLNGITGGMSETLGTVVESLSAVFQSLLAVVQPVTEMIGALVSSVMPIVQQAIATVVDFVTGSVLPTVNEVLATVQPVVQQIAADIGAKMPMIQAVLQQAMAVIKGVVDTVWPHVKNIIMTVVSGIMSFMQKAWPAISAVIDAAMVAISTVIEVAWPVIQGIIETVSSAIEGIVSTVWPVISGVVETAAGAITAAIEGIESVVGVVEGIFDGVRSAIEDPIGTAQRFIEDFCSSIESIIGGLDLSLPSIALPHFSVWGGEFPFGIGGQGSAPEFSVSWYAQGGMVEGAQLIGAGERGAELIWPSYEPYLSQYADAIASRIGGGGVDIHDCTFNVRRESDIRKVAVELNTLINRQTAGGYA